MIQLTCPKVKRSFPLKQPYHHIFTTQTDILSTSSRLRLTSSRLRLTTSAHLQDSDSHPQHILKTQTHILKAQNDNLSTSSILRLTSSAYLQDPAPNHHPTCESQCMHSHTTSPVICSSESFFWQHRSQTRTGSMPQLRSGHGRFFAEQASQ